MASNVRRSSPHPVGRRGRWLVACTVVALMVSLRGLVGAAAQGSGSDWPQYLHDTLGSGFTSETLINPSNAPSLKPRVGWPVALANGAGCPSAKDFCSNIIASQAVIATEAAGTLVYVGSWNGDEYALCAISCTVGATTYTSGQVVWSTYVGRTSGCGGPLSSALRGVTSTAVAATVVIGGVSRAVVFVGGGGDIAFSGGVIAGATADLFALDALTGAVIWQTPVGAAPSHYLFSSPVLVNNTLYIGISSDADCPLVQGGLDQLDAGSGLILNTFSTVPAGCTGGGVWGSAAVDSSGDVYVGTGNQGHCRTNEVLAPAVLKLTPTLSLLSTWRIPKAEQIQDGDIGSTPTLFPGTVTSGGQLRSLLGVASKNGVYYVLDQSNLGAGPVQRLQIAIAGTSPESGQGSISPSSSDGTLLYVAGGQTTINGVSFKGSLRAFDPNNLGAAVWQHGLTSGPVLGAVTTDPGLAVVGAGKYVTVISSSSGTTLFSAVARRFYAAASIADGVIYIGDYSGSLRAYSVNGA